MEVALERILESLLVGALGSLLLLGFIFIFFGHRFRIPMIRRLFKFLLYEEHLAEPRPADDLPRAYQLFVTALLVAALYGFGLVTEALSDGLTSSRFMTKWAEGYRLSFGSDPTIKREAFEAVGKSVVTMGGATRKFSQFVTDYRACDKTVFAQKPNESKADTGPCAELISRGKTLYYSAKNIILREDTYAKELGDLQRRINFTRSMSQTLFLLSLELTLMALLGAVAENFYERVARRNHARSESPQRPKLLLEVFAHWRDFAAVRCLVLGAGALGMASISLLSWRYEEDQFDRRTFGYFLSYGLELSETGTDEVATQTKSRDALEADNSRRGIYAWAIPQSPYQVFGFGGGHFEPSGVTRIGERRYAALLVNDKDQMQPFVLFDLSKSDSLENGRSLPLPSLAGEERTRYGKMESVQAVKRGGQTIVYASTTFGSMNPEARRIITFALPESGTPVPKVPEVAQLPLLGDPCAVLFENAREPEGGCIIEGIAVPNPGEEKEILLGVRRKRDNGGAMRPAVAIVKLVKKDAGWSPEKVFELTLAMEDEFPCAPFSGISDLDMTDKGDLLILTSIELENKEDQKCLQTGKLEPIQEVQGALWKFSAATNLGTLLATDWPKHRVARFAHKPEGVTMLDDGAALVVFDDDGDRKSRAAAPGSFALDHEESVYAVVRGVARR